jgi:hypothetical protein
MQRAHTHNILRVDFSAGNKQLSMDHKVNLQIFWGVLSLSYILVKIWKLYGENLLRYQVLTLKQPRRQRTSYSQPREPEIAPNKPILGGHSLLHADIRSFTHRLDNGSSIHL